MFYKNLFEYFICTMIFVKKAFMSQRFSPQNVNIY